MSASQKYQQLIATEHPGLPATAARGVLRILAGGYGLGVALRNQLFDMGVRRIATVDVPVLSVGNLTTGGSGKTPMVIRLCEHYSRVGLRVAVLARGYGARHGEFNDELKLISRRCPDVFCIAHPDRVASAKVALDRYEPDVFLLDDGFQHRRLARDLDIVLLDATRPFGYEHLLPRGLLREPPAALRRANIIVLTHADRLDDRDRAALVDRIGGLTGGEIDIVSCRHQPSGLVTTDGQPASNAPSADARVVCLSSIARPVSFEQTVRQMGYSPVACRAFPDHHAYTSENLADIAIWAGELGADAILTTEKDAVKIEASNPPADVCPILAVRIDIDFLFDDGTIFDAQVDACLGRTSAQSSGTEP